MSVAGNAASAWARWRQAAEVYRNRKQLIILLMGFASGAPFLLTGSVLSTWMGTINVDLTTIGLFALVGTPYAFKFVWAPLVDRLSLPLLDPVPVGTGSSGAGSTAVGDVREALTGLGYGHDEIRDALRELPSTADAATLLREALKMLGAKRA